MPTIEDEITRIANLSYLERRRVLIKLERFRDEVLPNKKIRFLYKYRDIKTKENKKHINSVVLDSELWFSSILSFNDPFDSQWKTVIEGSDTEKVERAKKILLTHSDLLPEGANIESEIINLLSHPELLKITEEVSRQNMNKHGVLCLGSEPRSILMWSHYANSHRGIAYQFEIAKDVDFFHRAVSAKYFKNYPIRNWVADSQEEASDAIYGKFKDWEYEKERRLLKTNQANTSWGFKPEALTGILLGINFDDFGWLEELLQERFKRYGDHLKIYQAIKSDNDYSISLKEYKESKNI